MSEDPATTADGRGDEVYQPTGSDASNRPSDPYDPENALDTDATEAVEDPGYSPPDRPRAVTRHGTTPREQREGSSLDDRLAQERPDVTQPRGDELGDLPDGEGEPVDEEAGATRAGRLVGPEPAIPGGVAAEDVGLDDGTASAEEAAVHRDTGIDGR
ncbi:DUF5709 domain-containing protein [Streptomyces sp. NPDC126499]|uniref:DUF5709 domain-containing protein n=1 Tax=Streptomyces sp. NPDC126499 TaxID=3155314 RepID=UPI0033336ECB